MDVVTTRISIVILGLACGVGLGGAIWLAAIGIETPQILIATIASCTAGIVGILVKTRDDGNRQGPDFTKNPPLP